MKRVLFITNGRAEDQVAAEIIKVLDKKIETEMLSLVDPSLPGGGFSLRNSNYLLRDLSSGLLGFTLKQFSSLIRQRGKYALSVAIGDSVPLVAALVSGAPLIFVGVNKSDYYRRFGYCYTPWEKWLLKKYAKKIFVRDKLTMQNLNRQGIPAEYAGNPLMDGIAKDLRRSDNQREKIRKSEDQNDRNLFTIGFLPGTREDAKLNLDDFEKVVEELVNLKDPDMKFKCSIATTLSDIPEYMERKSFAEVLAEADIVVGLSGTGNEQAAGCGIPAVSFWGCGAQYNKSFAAAQKQLLGEALELVKGRDLREVACIILQIIKNPGKMLSMGAAGKERMGEQGAIPKIADYLKGELYA
jgi:hypothetical protein